MDEHDYDHFAAAVQRAATAYRIRIATPALDELTRTYFEVLESFPLKAVTDALARWLETQETFPKAAEWRAAIVKVAYTTTAKPDVRWMSASEIAELARAHSMRYQDVPCDCLECRKAHVTEFPLRFVPTLTGNGDEEERAFNQVKNRVEVVGHWAHGAELRRWYDAKAAFERKAPQNRRRAAALLQSREPGQEG